MRRLLLTVALLLTVGQLVGGFTFPTGSGGSVAGGGGAADTLLFRDTLHTTETAGECEVLTTNATGTLVCTSEATRIRLAQATTLTTLEASIHSAPGTTGACTLTLLDDIGAIAQTTKIMIGDQDVADRSRIGTAGAVTSVPINAQVAAGGFVSVRFDTEATGCTGGAGCSCTNIAVTGMGIAIYGVR